MTNSNDSQHPALEALRRFTRPKPQGPRCELCSAPIAEEHSHLLEVAQRKLSCCCEPCAILFPGQDGARYRRVGRRILELDDFHIDDMAWEDMHLPINLAFFVARGNPPQVVASYPSPAGAVESLLTLETWQTLVDSNPVLGEMQPEVEALLIHRIGPARRYYLVSIDHAFHLVGLIRMSWKGLSGGSKVWTEINRFFDALDQMATRHSGMSQRKVHHA